MKAKTLAARFSFICVQANEKTLRSISLKRQHSKSTFIVVTERYDTVMLNIRRLLQRHGYHTIFFIYFMFCLCFLSKMFGSSHGTEKRKDSNGFQTVVQCLNSLFIKKCINLVNKSSKLQKSQIKIHMRRSQKKRINGRLMLRKKMFKLK